MALLSYALTDVLSVTEQMEETLTSSQQKLVENMINFCTQYAENYTGRLIKARDVDTTEKIDIMEYTDLISLRNLPIQSITSVTEDGDVLVEDTDYYVYEDTGELVRIDQNWVKGRRKVEVSYIGGFSTVPEDLKQWCNDMVIEMYSNKSVGGDLVSETVGGITQEYAESSSSGSADSLLGTQKMKNEVLDLYCNNYI